MADPVVYLNEQFMPLSEARIPVLDRGFIFGDGVYDVVPVYQRKMFRAHEHLDRLARSMQAIGIVDPYSREQWLALIERLINDFDADDQVVYIQVTRGVAPRAHAFPAEAKPTVFMMATPFKAPTPTMREQGVACVTMEDKRWLHCNIKSTSLLGNVLAAQNAAEHGVTETILFRDGLLTEASASNVWIVKDGVVLGPKKSNQVLEGIRYGLFEELCAANDIPFELRDITVDEVLNADEVLLSSAVKEVLPVTLIDGRPVGDGAPGPMYRRLYALYQGVKAQSGQEYAQASAAE